MPITVLAAIRQASQASATVKGGKFLEAIAEADTIVFDKTGTLTKAKPTVSRVYSFNGMPEDELLRIAACLEEHFPHSMAKAVLMKLAEETLCTKRCILRLNILLHMEYQHLLIQARLS